MTLTETYWRTPDETRHFIIPDAASRQPGSLVLRSLAGDALDADLAWAARFEVSEIEARAWAHEEFGFVLDQVRHRIEAKLAAARASLDEARHSPVAPGSPISADAVPAIVTLVRRLPRAILDGLSGEAERVGQAGAALSEVEARLGAAGIDVAPKLGSFPERLAGLRRDLEIRGR